MYRVSFAAWANFGGCPNMDRGMFANSPQEDWIFHAFFMGKARCFKVSGNGAVEKTCNLVYYKGEVCVGFSWKSLPIGKPRKSASIWRASRVVSYIS